MLDLLRRNSKHWSVTFIMVIATLSMVFFFGTYNGQRKINRAWVAKVNGEKIKATDFYKKYSRLRDYYKNQMGDKFSDKVLEMYGFKQQLLNSMIDDVLLYQEAKKSNIPVTDEELRDVITSYPYFQKNGKFDVQLYKSLLPRMRTTVHEFEKEQRMQLAKEKIEALVSNAVKLSNSDLKYIYQIRNAKLSFKYLSFDPKLIKVRVNNKELASYIKNHKERIKSYYTEHNNEFIVPDQRNVLWLKISYNPQKPDSKDKAKRKIDGLILGLNKTNFASITKKYSDAPKKGIVGYVSKKELPSEVANEVFSASIGKISTVFEADNSFNVILVKAKKDTYIKRLDDVKFEIAKKLLTEGKKTAKEKSIVAKIEKAGSLKVVERLLKSKAKRTDISLTATRVLDIPSSSASLVSWLFTQKLNKPVYQKIAGKYYVFYPTKKQGMKFTEKDLEKHKAEYKKQLGREEFWLFRKNLRMKYHDKIKVSEVLVGRRG